MSHQKSKLRLLAHMQNMLLAAENKDWQNLVALDSQWRDLLKETIETSPKMVESIAPLLQESNKKIMQLLNQEQNKLANDTSRETSSHKAIKQYLK